MYIYLSYVSLVLSLCLFNYETTHHSQYKLIQYMCLLPAILIHFIPLHKKRLLFQCLYFAVVVYYTLFKENSIIVHVTQNVIPAMFIIARYSIFYEYGLHRMNDLMEAKRYLPYYAIVSNLGNVLEKRSYELLDRIEFEHKLYASIGLCILSIVFGVLLPKEFDKNVIYNNQLRSRRTLVQSSSFGLSYYIMMWLSKKLDTNLLSFHSPYDFLPIAGIFALVFANKHMFVWLESNHVYIYMTINLCTVLATILIQQFSVDDNYSYIHKLLFVLGNCSHYLIFDPIHFLLYVTHSCSIIQIFGGFDMFALFLATICVNHILNTYALVTAVICFMSFAEYSKKYYNKDILYTSCEFGSSV